MKVKVTGTLVKESGFEEFVDLECEVLSRLLPTMHETLVCNGYLLLKTMAGSQRFFFFSGSRLVETKTQEEAERLGALLCEEEIEAATSQPNSRVTFSEYQERVEIGGAFASYSESGDEATIHGSV